MIKFFLFIICLFSLVIGLVFAILPEWFLSKKLLNTNNIFFMRYIGATILGINFLGCFSLYYKPHGKISLLRIISLTSLFQTFSLIYSRFYNEFLVTNLLFIDLAIICAILTSIYLLYLFSF